MDERVIRILFFAIWVVFGLTYSYRLLFKPEQFDQGVERLGRRLGKEPPDQESRHRQYRSVGIILLLGTVFALYVIVQTASEIPSR